MNIKIVLPGYKKYKEMLPKSKDIIFVNSRVYDDSALIQLAINHNLPILSNDKFNEYRTIYLEHDFENHVFSFDIILGVLVTQLTDYCRIMKVDYKSSIKV